MDVHVVVLTPVVGTLWYIDSLRDLWHFDKPGD